MFKCEHPKSILSRLIGRLSKKEKEKQHSKWFKSLQRFRCGIEGALACLRGAFRVGMHAPEAPEQLLSASIGRSSAAMYGKQHYQLLKSRSHLSFQRTITSSHLYKVSRQTLQYLGATFQRKLYRGGKIETILREGIETHREVVKIGINAGFQGGHRSMWTKTVMRPSTTRLMPFSFSH